MKRKYISILYACTINLLSVSYKVKMFIFQANFFSYFKKCFQLDNKCLLKIDATLMTFPCDLPVPSWCNSS